ncbi:MAG: GntR family transcriptional regulator [Acidobacteria bacterium]|nr:GntR family transcriptional regulator [Acidobacteriota bacterium]
MDIQINRRSDVPVREQLSEQVIYMIVTGRWKSGAPLPSVRELARRLGIHHNTVSESYSKLVERGWLVRRRGSRLLVRSAEMASEVRANGLEELVNAMISFSREQKWSLQELRTRLLDRLMVEPADHILIVEPEDGLRKLLQAELKAALKIPVNSCSVAELAGQPNLLIGAQVAAPNYLAKDVKPLVPKSRPLVELRFGTIEQARGRILQLTQPALIAMISVSPAILMMARSLFAPAERLGHTLMTYSFPMENPSELRVVDLVICDSLSFKQVRNPRAIEFRVISEDSIQSLSAAMK